MKNKWENLSKELGIEKYVVFHGTKVSKELDMLFDRCDVAIGCLGIYRKKTVRASTLKNKEYCARGIPFVFACEEKYLHSKLDFVKVLPDNDEIIDIDEIVEFHKRMQKREDISSVMIEYAKKYFLWSTQIESILDALQE